MKRILVGAVVITFFGWSAFSARAADRSAQEHFEAGNKLFDERKYPEAVERYTQALAINPQMVEAYFNKALAHEQRDRSRAFKAWQEFIAAAEGKPAYKSQVTLIKNHVKNLSAPSSLPASLALSNYSEREGDYWALVIEDSLGGQWTHFPVKVFITDPPQKKMDDVARQAVSEWSAYLPLKLVHSPDEADIRIGWVEEEQPRYGKVVAGEAADILEVDVSDKPSSLATAEINVLIYRKDRRPKKDIKAVILHELGHALGIKGHSDDERDLMYSTRRSRGALVGTGGGVQRVGRSMATEIGRRDANTLIKIYNTDTLLTRY